MRRTALLILLVSVVVSGGCTNNRTDLDYSYNIEQRIPNDGDLPGDMIQFEQVFWEPSDSASLRKLIREDSIAQGRRVLEIGTGTGVIALTCAEHGAKQVIATDINPAAVANARYNAANLDLEQNLEIRQVDEATPGAFSVLQGEPRFDLIISNPPWEDGDIKRPLDYAFYDPGFELMDSILDGLPNHLSPGGRCLLTYGHVPAIERLQAEATRRGLQCKVLDDRDLKALPKDFLPGMLVELRLGRDLIPNDAASRDE
ncbi:methyltransferase [Rhodopirellula sp. MGV]|uniref:methyltransferase n=1 Tax=Rhodopirellula sp. MGV TaxID=2023130 RepID=UPI0013041BAB|nr:methyltransferase [Rhodopirellula sp. MGV]